MARSRWMATNNKNVAYKILVFLSLLKTQINRMEIKTHSGYRITKKKKWRIGM